MYRRHFVTLALGAFFIPSASFGADPAETSARAWLTLVDSGKYADSWKEAGTFFRNAVKQDDWASQLKGVRNPLGKLGSRKLKSATPAKSLPGAPDGDYVVLMFDASFENKKEAIETVTVVRESDKQRVVGYFIR